jgi:NADH:ubiquinone oxidoreductase subunit 2 (subunit N)
MTINVFAIVLALFQNRLKYIANLSTLTKINPILTITLFIIMFSYAGIHSPVSVNCNKRGEELSTLRT